MILLAVMTLPVNLNRSISVNVTDGTDAVSGAKVVFDDDADNTKTTGSAGGCTANLTDGEHTIAVSADGYTTYTNTITVSEDNTAFSIVLTAE